MVYSREEIVRRALASVTNEPGYCQMWTRTMAGAPSAGDRDHDGDADAVDGWLSEPTKYRHPGDANAPAGTIVAWSGGSSGNGYRAISLGKNDKNVTLIRSTDAAGRGRVGTVDLRWVERTWRLKYLGWSESITGILIPTEVKPPKPKTSRGAAVDDALARLRKAKAKPGTERERMIDRAIEALQAVDKIR